MSEGSSWGALATVLAALIAGICSIVVVLVKQNEGPPVPPGSVQPAAMGKLAGVWEGSFFQETPIRDRKLFAFEVQLSQADSALTGSSRESVPNTSYFAVIGVSGYVKQDRTVSLQDSDVRQSFPVQLPGGHHPFWVCSKTATLKLSPDGNTLEGTWEAPNCGAGGTMKLRRS